MCGISCLLSLSPACCEWDTRVYEHLKRRGPDCSHDITVTSSSPFYQCLFSAHVLHMRGVLTPQPLQDSTGNILMWNGEIFGGLTVTATENDTVVLLQRLSTCGSASGILSVLSSVRGPWGFVYYQKAAEYLWFGRDFFGRRSLLWKFEAGLLTLTSVAANLCQSDESVWHEVPAVGVYGVDLRAASRADRLTFEVYPWTCTGADDLPKVDTISESVPNGCTVVVNQSGLSLTSPVCRLNVALPELINHSQPPVDDLDHLLTNTEVMDDVDSLVHVLSQAVRRRVQALPLVPDGDDDRASVAILFSGGIDSMILAVLADRHIPAEKPIDLLNVAFKLQEKKKQKQSVRNSKKKPVTAEADVTDPGTFRPFDVPDRITGKAGMKELQQISPERRWNFVEINVTPEELKTLRGERITHLVWPLDTVLDDSIGCAVWFASRGSGVIMEGGETRPFSSSAKVRQCLHQQVILILGFQY